MAENANQALLVDKFRSSGLPITFAACFLSLSAPLMTHVLHGYYGVGAPEAWIAFGLVAAFAASYAAIHLRVGQLTQRLLEMLLIMLLAELYIEKLQVSVLLSLAWLVAGYLLKTAPHRFLVAFGCAALLTSIATSLIDRKPWIGDVVDQTAKARPATSTGPAIIHVILDEHIGLAGLPPSPKGQETGRVLQDAYLAQGFTTYERAYSRHLHTINAVPDILNFGRRLGQSGTIAGGIAGPTDYLAGLRKAGYALSIYQSNFLDICSGADEELCVTYDRGSLQPFADVGLSVSDKVEVLLARYLGASRLLTAAQWYYRFGEFGEWAKSRPRPQGFKTLRDSWSIAGQRAMDRYVSDLKQARAGNAYLIHAMFPHYPYVTSPDCAVKPVSTWLRRIDARSQTEREEAYFDQLRCTMRYVDRIVAAVNESPAGDNAIMIIHGDHGSRIVNVDPTEARRGTINREQLITSFSTLFAVRVPGQQARNHPGIISAPAILQALVQDGFKTAPAIVTDTQPSVILDDSRWKPTQPIALPTDW